MEKDFFIGNRSRLLEAIDSSVVAVLTAYTSMQLTNDAAAPFQQESNFWYLTGIEDPDWRVIVTRERSWLVMPQKTEIHMIFDGGTSAEMAMKISGVDEVIGAKEASELLTRLATTHKTVYALDKDPYEKYYDFSCNPAPHKLWRQLGRVFDNREDLRRILAKLRAVKQPQELEAVRRSIAITLDAFTEAVKRLQHIEYEYELEAEFTAAFRRQNARHGYDPIVAGGKNACTLHYSRNAARLQQSSLVLVDIGARLQGYSADITRTYAVGDATPRQHAVHAAVRDAHLAIVDLLKPGLTIVQYQQKSDEIMKQCLDSLGLLNKPADYRRYFPHAISHGLGIDVHDSLGGHQTFQPGMVLTVEPGVYIPEEEIGVRLEDNICITDKGRENLSKSLSLNL